MVPFLNLKSNGQYRKELITAVTGIIDSGRYMQGDKVTDFEQEYANYCEVEQCVGVTNGLDALVLRLRAWKELGKRLRESRVGEHLVAT